MCELAHVGWGLRHCVGACACDVLVGLWVRVGACVGARRSSLGRVVASGSRQACVRHDVAASPGYMPYLPSFESGTTFLPQFGE